MKTIITFLLLTFFSIPSLLACDICGSGSGNTYFGLMPGFQKKFVGIRYQNNSLKHHLGPNGETTYLSAKEQFHIVEAWGAINLGQRFRVAGFMPFSFATREQHNTVQQTSGLGDISVVGYYKLADKNISANLKHQAWVGAGLKLPTGKYNAEESNIQQGAQNSFQLGSGSLDYILNAVYDIQYKMIGVNTNLSYRINTANTYNYGYGDKWNLNLQAYPIFDKEGKTSWKPHVGFLYEQAARDHNEAHLEVWQSGGKMGLGTVGIDVSLGRIGVTSNYQQVLFQNLGEGRILSGNRFIVGMNLVW